MSDQKMQKITACAFIHKDGKLFAPRRALIKTFLPGAYELPGGHIEFGESMEEGLQRELMEEFGIEIVIGEPFFAFTYTRDNDTIHSIEVDYFATLKYPDEQIHVRPEEHAEYHWISESELFKYYDKNDKETEAIIRGFAILNNR